MITMYQASVPLFVRQLGALSAVLDKGAAHAATLADGEATLLEGRLAPDMLPLPKHAQIAADTAAGCVARLAGIEMPPFGDDESSIAALRARIDRAIGFIESVPADAIEQGAERPIALTFPNREFQFTGRAYLLDFVQPNMLFHTAIAYAILRLHGVPLGKRDFLGDL